MFLSSKQIVLALRHGELKLCYFGHSLEYAFITVLEPNSSSVVNLFFNNGTITFKQAFQEFFLLQSLCVSMCEASRFHEHSLRVHICFKRNQVFEPVLKVS